MLTIEADDYTLYYHNLARLANKSGRFDLVVLAWQNALQVNPDDEIAKTQLEYGLRECTEIELSLTEAKQELDDAPDAVEECYHLAHYYLALGDVAKAKAEWGKIAARNLENWSKSACKMIRKHCGAVD